MKTPLLIGIALSALLSGCIVPVVADTDTGTGTGTKTTTPSTPQKSAPAKTTPTQTPADIAIIQAPVVIISKPVPQDNQAHICTLSAFTYTYKGEDTNLGKARLSAKKQCLNNFHEMHCRDEDIKCSSY